ncbi:TetR/AcrR family transcriptional regulator [Paenibacillus glucanolyticus]|uniref:TetR/AcrR family transcriptional regulator n=1 Tax=Paenibacillus glucanolyticus TaxID=59843 RepID=UPI00096F3CAF|nr:TetR/AcrR family transcriptional regulator [Paenibacillus glucanolyticus]OMF69653.1 TetR family transcriptional regulator [Paenibacillus glucanolyticus]
MRRSKSETNETIQLLLKVARAHFTDRGYANAALEEIAEEAKVTRGALYHHFKNKQGLFLAVLELVQTEISDRVEREAVSTEDPWDQLLIGCRAFIAAVVEPQNKRIMLIDGPSVVGWEAWREMDEQNSMSHLREQLVMMQEQGILKPVPVDAMTHALSGALNECSLWIAQMPETAVGLEETMDVITGMLKGFRVNSLT